MLTYVRAEGCFLPRVDDCESMSTEYLVSVEAAVEVGRVQFCFVFPKSWFCDNQHTRTFLKQE